MPEPVRGIFFDLDGTFADTAPDLGAALNRLRTERGEAPVPLSNLRAFTSQGVRGMLRAGMGINPADHDYAALSRRFLEHYATHLCAETRIFPGITELLDTAERKGLPWGVVTNKPHRFTLPLMSALGYARRAACIVSGNSAPRAKPHPDPLRLAAALAGLSPDGCIYVGDDRRDIVAGVAAGMCTVAVRYGYLGDDGPVETWGAHFVVDHPHDIIPLLD